jgi:imidazolonepropionase-like amidohydrolase
MMFSCTSGDQDAFVGHVDCLCHRPELQRLSRRISGDLSRRGFVAGVASSVAALGMPKFASAQSAPVPAAPSRPILFTNFRLFDGKSDSLRDGLRLLVEGNLVKTVAEGNPAAPEGAQVIDCGGRTIMPGLIDMHWHTIFASLPPPVLMSSDIGYIHLAASAEAERTLMRGFTTIRDMGGPSYALKQAIDEGLVSGPRIYPSGPMITASGGHGDLRELSDLPATPARLSHIEEVGGAAIVDSPDLVRLRVREQLLQGASQLKLVASGGVASPRSPLDSLPLTEAELRAGVEAAADWSTYVTVHAYVPAAIKRAVAAGVKCVEHGHLMDEESAKLLADKGIWLSLQPFLSSADAVPLTGESAIKLQEVIAGTDNAYRLAKKHQIKTAFGTDILFSGMLTGRQGTMLSHLAQWYGNAEILKMATSTNAELLGLSGPRNPYPGKLGVIEDGAFADLLLVDGDPVKDITLVADPAKNFVVIMKDGRIHKNTLAA